MKKVLNVLKKYYIFAFIVSSFITISSIYNQCKSGNMMTISFIFIVKMLMAILLISILMMPLIAIIDFLIVKSAKALFKDYKQADKSGKIIIIVVFILALIRKILILTR